MDDLTCWHAIDVMCDKEWCSVGHTSKRVFSRQLVLMLVLLVSMSA